MSDPNEEPNDDLLQESENGENTTAEDNTEVEEQQDSLAHDDSEVLNDTAGNELDETVEDATLDEIRMKMKEMEEEATKLRQYQADVDEEMNLSSSSLPGVQSPQFLSQDEKKEIDARSIYVGNVDYGATAEELEQHFHGCGSINRVTINCDKYTGHPKGFAYVEFTETDSVELAQALDESLFRGRQIKVTPKRTNIPGHSTTNRPPRGRGRGFRGSRGFRGGGGYRGRAPFRGAYRGRGRASHYAPY